MINVRRFLCNRPVQLWNCDESELMFLTAMTKQRIKYCQMLRKNI